MMQKLNSLVLIGSSLLVGACANRATGSAEEDTDSAVGAIDSSDATEAEGNLMMASVDGTDTTGLPSLTSVDLAARIAANVALHWNPSGCAVVTHTDSLVSITYDDCTGPRGLIHVTGTLALALSISTTGAITVHATSDSLQVNRADLMIDATATYSVSATSHSLTVQTTGSGTGPRGSTIDHEGNYTITWDPSSMCRTIEGQWDTQIGSRERSNDVSLQRCAGGCPTGTLTHHFLAGASVTVTFDGTATAHWTTSAGVTGTTTLTCQ